jgi:hypothetical protein
MAHAAKNSQMIKVTAVSLCTNVRRALDIFVNCSRFYGNIACANVACALRYCKHGEDWSCASIWHLPCRAARSFCRPCKSTRLGNTLGVDCRFKSGQVQESSNVQHLLNFVATCCYGLRSREESHVPKCHPMVPHWFPSD